MAFQFTLEKVLHVRESEKNALEVEYRDAYQDFEKVARILYEFLKQKETIQARQLANMAKGTPIHDVQSLQMNLEFLQNKINRYETLFQDARRHTEQKKELLLDKSIDVKRYEKLKAFHLEAFHKKSKSIEASNLDEISTIRHLKQ